MAGISFSIDPETKSQVMSILEERGFGSLANGMRQLTMTLVDHPEILNLINQDADAMNSDTNSSLDMRFDHFEDLLDTKAEDIVNSVKSTNETAQITHQLVTELQEDVNRVSDNVNDLSHNKNGQQFNQEAMDKFRKQLVDDLKIMMFDYMMNNQRGFTQPASNPDDRSY